MTATVTKLSLCPCGFPLFNDYVKIGQRYELRGLPPDDQFHSGTLTCGGCGTVIPVTLAMSAGGVGRPGCMPIEAFEFADETALAE